MAFPYFSGTKMTRIVRFLRAYKRVIVFLLIFAWAAFPLMYAGDFGLTVALVRVGINLVFIGSQIFWIRRVRELGVKLITSKHWRKGLGRAGLIVYFFLFAYNVLNEEEVSRGSGMTVREALLGAPFTLWLFGSLLGFLIAILVRIADRVAHAVRWVIKTLIVSPRPRCTPQAGGGSSSKLHLS
jgi:hypothetical protein